MRESGYYRVKYRSKWIIAKYDSIENLWMTMEEYEYYGGWSDDYVFDEIDERQIEFTTKPEETPNEKAL